MENPIIEKDIIIKCKLGDMVKRFFKDYMVVWHDPNLETEENELHKAHLERFCKIETFTEWDKASTYVQGTKKICHVITSGRYGELLTREICSNENVLSIYVFCRNKESHSSWAKNYQKIACVEILIQNILNQIEQKLLEWLQQESSRKMNLPVFAPIFNDIHKSHMNNLHRYLKIIPNFKNREQAKEDFIALSREIYSKKKNINDISDFERNYNEYDRGNVLKWYTRECFLYKVTNNCLRIATSESIQYCRLLLRDMQEAIKEQYRMKSKDFNGLLYRAAYLSEEEWSNLKENTDREIEMHGFLSVSKKKNVALKFLQMDPEKKVFITIIVPKGPTEEEQGFAEIEEFSQFPHEEEILFNVRSRFTVLETDEKYSEEFPSRHLVLLYGAQGFRRFISEKNPVQEISIAKDISCNQCKAPSSEVSEKMMLVPIINPGNVNYCCNQCLQNSIEFETTPLVCVSFADIPNCKLATSKIEIKGFLLMERESKIQFYGYKCSVCQAKKQKRYFTCTTCGEKRKKWCEICFKNASDCAKQGHTIILESSPFSFWCEQMSKKELNHLKVQNSSVSGQEFFQQALMYSKSLEPEKAIEYYQAYIHKNGPENKDEKIVICYNNLGDLYTSQGESKQAFACYSKALHISLSISGETNPEVANSYVGLGNTFFNFGDYKKARESYLKSLEIRKSFYGDTHPTIAACFNRLGGTYAKMGQAKKALEYHLKSVDIAIASEENSHNLIFSYMEIGTLYSNEDKLKMALEYYLKALDIGISVYGEIHPLVASSYLYIGETYQKLGDDEMALKFHLKSFDTKTLVYKNAHFDFVWSYNSLGRFFQQKREWQTALEFFENSLQTSLELYKEDHPDIANSYDCLGDVYSDMEEYKKARQYYFKSMEIRKSLYGSAHPGLTGSFFRIGRLYKNMGKEKKALNYYEKALDIQKSCYGKNHLYVAEILYSIAEIYDNLGESEKALRYCFRCLNIQRSIYGENHVHVADSYQTLGAMYEELENYDTSLEYSLKSLGIKISVYGENHSNVADSYHSVGIIYQDMKKYDKALEYYLKSLDIKTLLSGEDYLETEDAQDILNAIIELANMDLDPTT